MGTAAIRESSLAIDAMNDPLFALPEVNNVLKTEELKCVDGDFISSNTVSSF